MDSDSEIEEFEKPIIYFEKFNFDKNGYWKIDYYNGSYNCFDIDIKFVDCKYENFSLPLTFLIDNIIDYERDYFIEQVQELKQDLTNLYYKDITEEIFSFIDIESDIIEVLENEKRKELQKDIATILVDSDKCFEDWEEINDYLIDCL